MNKKQNYSNWKEKQKEPPKTRRIRLEIYDDGLYVGTINTDITVKKGESIAEESLIEYVKQRMPSYRKKKYLTIRIA